MNIVILSIKMLWGFLANDQLHQMEKSNDIRAQNKKQAACKIISWVTDKRITIHSARISIFLLQNFRCIIYILAEEVGTHHNRNEDEFRCRKENSYHFVDSLFVTLKMHKHNIYFAQRWDCVQRFKRNKKSPLYFLLRGWKAPNIVWNIIIGRHELAISLTTIHLVVR